MKETEFAIADRVGAIRAMAEKYDLEGGAYLSFSGGSDSCLAYRLIDEALPGNRIPRVFINTGVEYNEVLRFVRELQREDDRIVFLSPKGSFKKKLEDFGYPFKSKEHSSNLSLYQRDNGNATARKYLSKSRFGCPKCLAFQFEPGYPLKVSSVCCRENKKKVAREYERASGRWIHMTGMRKAEGGIRAASSGCVVKGKDGNVASFNPLFPVSDAEKEGMIKALGVRLPSLYYPPFNFKRTGCKGCPYAIDLQRELDLLEEFFPAERKQCEAIWGPVYDEYRRLGYRLCKKGETRQLRLEM